MKTMQTSGSCRGPIAALFGRLVQGWVVAGRGLSSGLIYRGPRQCISVIELADQRAKPSAAHRERCHAELTRKSSTVTAQPDSHSNGI